MRANEAHGANKFVPPIALARIQMMKNIKYSLAFVALLPLLFPLNAWSVNPAARKTAKVKTNTDIALTRDNTLNGRLFDETGNPVGGMSVAIYSQGHMTAATVSDQAGSFSLVTNRGGVYELRAGNEVQIIRLWHHDTAPPSAESTIQLRVGEETVRGQRPIESLFCFQPWFLGLLIAAAIAIPIAVHDSDSRPAS